jgi:uncharacterized protein (TIGR02453 family)
METFAGYPPKAFTFLRGLAKHNRKEWFEAHRDDYEVALRAPMRALIDEVDVRLAAFIPEVIGSPKRSMFRIHRDVRFSKDKSPYKTNAACWFYHADAGRGVGTEAAHGGAGFYLHLEPGASFCGGGIWMPPRSALAKIRTSLADDPEAFTAIVRDRGFVRRFGALDTEGMLTRMPRGYAPDHPAGDWLRYTSFTAGCAVTTEQLQSAKLPDLLARQYAAMTPFVRWLNGALGLPERTRR